MKDINKEHRQVWRVDRKTMTEVTGTFPELSAGKKVVNDLHVSCGLLAELFNTSFPTGTADGVVQTHTHICTIATWQC